MTSNEKIITSVSVFRMTIFLSKLVQNNIKIFLVKYSDTRLFTVSYRNFSIVPNLYDGKEDPAPKFFAPNVQVILRRLTRPDLTKIFRKRTNSGRDVLLTPIYKFLTNEDLEAELLKANKRADRLLQMPPVVKVQQPINEILSEDPALIGYDTAKYLFTDITFGVDNEHRLIVQRDPDGTLCSCDYDVRKRLNQTYFPIKGRKIREPMMFTDEERFNSLLEREEYEFVLDRACLQYEPDEHSYQRITSITYQHIDMNKKYEKLRSTRHFGTMTFYLTWHQSMDNLMLELLQISAVREAVLLTALRQEIHADVANGDNAKALADEILLTPVQLAKPDRLTEEDIKLDTRCVECIEKYIVSNSTMKAQQELALQGFREYYQQLIELSRGLKKAHGSNT